MMSVLASNFWGLSVQNTRALGAGAVCDVSNLSSTTKGDAHAPHPGDGDAVAVVDKSFVNTVRPLMA